MPPALPQKARIVTILIGVVFLSSAFFLPAHMKTGWWAGYFTGLLTIVFYAVTAHLSSKKPGAEFITHYYAGMLIRFCAVCAVFIFLLVMTKIDEFSFTVSFIISYLLHSINEVIILNKKLSD